eukprot:4981224-Prymnesium_polylepis.1
MAVSHGCVTWLCHTHLAELGCRALRLLGPPMADSVRPAHPRADERPRAARAAQSEQDELVRVDQPKRELLALFALRGATRA